MPKRVKKQLTPKNFENQIRQYCWSCSKNLGETDKLLYVEKEVGRIFCSKKCIIKYFQPEIDQLEKTYFHHLPSNDLSHDERANFAYLRWRTLQNPNEIWLNLTPEGDHRYTLIAEFTEKHQTIWCVCQCLYLEGEPSFLYLAFQTREPSLLNHYRQGELISIPIKNKSKKSHMKKSRKGSKKSNSPTTPNTQSQDLSAEDLALQQQCLGETLEHPDEVWSFMLNTSKLYHFLRWYSLAGKSPHEKKELWYIIVARETEDEDQIEIIDAFPTQDLVLVEQFRRGKKEYGSTEISAARVVH